MAVSYATLTGNIRDIAEGEWRGRAWLEANVDFVVDTDAEKIRIGDRPINVAADGSWTVADLIASVEPFENLQYRVRAMYSRLGEGRGNVPWSSGWFSLTEDADLSEITEEQYIPPTFISQATQQLQGIVAGAEAAKTEAEAAAAQARDISNIDTPDALVKTLVEGPSETKDALTGGFGPVASAMAPRDRIVRRGDAADVISTFQHNHGFGIGNADPSSNANNTSGPVIGTQYATVVTKGDGTVSTLGKVVMPQVNFTEKHVRLFIRVHNIEHLNRLEVFATTDSGFANRFSWTGIGKAETTRGVNYFKGGELVTIDLSFADATVTGTPDRSKLNGWQVRVADDNTGQKVTLDVFGLYAVRKSAAFPRGVVSLTFDDGMQSQIDHALYAMEERGYKGTYYLIVDALGQTIGGDQFMTLDSARQLHAQGHDIGPHAYRLANHNLPDGHSSLTPDALREELRLLKDWCLANGFTRSADHYCSPKGRFTPQMLDIVSQFFTTHRTIVDTTKETLPPSDHMRLRIIPLPAATGKTLSQVLDAITAARAEGAWLILCGHKIVTGASTNSLECTKADWETIVAHIAATGIQVETVANVYAASDRVPAVAAPAIAVRVTNPASQAVANDTTTVLAFPEETFDPYNLYTAGSGASRITVDRAGKWVFTLSVGFPANATGVRQVAFRRNGTDVQPFLNQAAVPTPLPTRMGHSIVLDLAAGDYVEATAYQNSGGSLNVQGGGATTFAAHYLGA